MTPSELATLPPRRIAGLQALPLDVAGRRVASSCCATARACSTSTAATASTRWAPAIAALGAVLGPAVAETLLRHQPARPRAAPRVPRRLRAQSFRQASGRSSARNSGAEANENALKLALNATGRRAVVAFRGAFHGRTAAPRRCHRRHAAFPRRPSRCARVPFGDTAAARAAIDGSVAAVMLEPIQSLAGVMSRRAGFLAALRAACDAARRAADLRRGADRQRPPRGALGGAALRRRCPTSDHHRQGRGRRPADRPHRLVRASLAQVLAAARSARPSAAARWCWPRRRKSRGASPRRASSRTCARLAALPKRRRPAGGACAARLLLGLVLEPGLSATAVRDALLAQGVLVGTCNDPQVLRLSPPLVLKPAQAARLAQAMQNLRQKSSAMPTEPRRTSTSSRPRPTCASTAAGRWSSSSAASPGAHRRPASARAPARRGAGPGLARRRSSTAAARRPTTCSASLGEEPRKIDGRRVTNADRHARAAHGDAGELHGRARGRRALRGRGAVAGVSARPAASLRCAARRSRPAAAWSTSGEVGDVVAVDPAPLQALLEAGRVPVARPGGRTDAAGLLNVNADLLAAALAARARRGQAASLSPARRASWPIRATVDPALGPEPARARRARRRGRAGAGMNVKAAAIRARARGRRRARAHRLGLEPDGLLQRALHDPRLGHARDAREPARAGARLPARGRCMNLPALLQELVAIESPSGQEGAAADYAARLLATRGIEVERLGHSVLARWAPAGSAQGPVCSSIRTSTRSPSAGLDAPRDRRAGADGRLYGRGANDAKASVAAMLWTLLQLAESRPDARGALPGPDGLRGDLERRHGGGAGAARARRSGLAAVGTARSDGRAHRARGRARPVGAAVLRAVWSGRSCHAAHVGRAARQRAPGRGARAPRGSTRIDARGLAPADRGQHAGAHGARGRPAPQRRPRPRRGRLFDARLAPPNSAADAVALLRTALPSASIEIHSERLKPVETAAEHPLVRAAKSAARAAAVGSNTLSDMALLSGSRPSSAGRARRRARTRPTSSCCRTSSRRGPLSTRAWCLQPSRRSPEAGARGGGTPVSSAGHQRRSGTAARRSTRR